MTDPVGTRRTQRAIADLMGTLDRTDPFGEAQFAALETALSLLRAGTPHRARVPDPPQEHGADPLNLLSEALASARATVVATSYAFTRLSDARRAPRRTGPADPPARPARVTPGNGSQVDKARGTVS
ncbi:hypothetical protein ACFYW1_02170 [Streptomyces sp. NPDC002669]|uniref:hypothetical protein n=1 Tax=Streptomyces sp. NPDC002669 TaxID=3364658 RepID=UPI003677C03D